MQGIALGGLCVLLLSACSGPQPSRPNILLIVADDMGYTDAGFFGSEIATPHLDALALRGLRFTNFHAGPMCAPTRAMLMSGVTNGEVGVTGPAAVLADDVTTLPEMLQEAGYHTYMAGKWHLGHRPDESPAARGFDSSFALVRAGDNHLGASNFPEESVAYRRNGEPVEELPGDWFSSELYTDELIDAIRANEGDEAPWFGYLAFTAPHWPLQLPEGWIDRYAGRYEEGYDVLRETRVARARELGVFPEALELEDFPRGSTPWDELGEPTRARLSRAMELYAGMVENMDFHVGRLIDYLEASGQLDDTIVMFFSDNGAAGSDSSFRPKTIPRTDWDNSLENMGREGSFVAYGRGWAEAATAPYRGVKRSLHEGGTLVPAFVTHAAVANPGGLDRDYLTVMDVMPTLLEIAGAPPPTTTIRGRSFWPRVLGDSKPVHGNDENIPWLAADQRAALVRGSFKAVRDEDDPSTWRLYDLENDPGERHDLSAELPELKSELVAAWAEYVEGL